MIPRLPKKSVRDDDSSDEDDMDMFDPDGR